MRRKVKSVYMSVHPSLFEEAEKFRVLLEKNGIKPSSVKATGLMAKYIKVPNKLNLIENGKKTKKRKYI